MRDLDDADEQGEHPGQGDRRRRVAGRQQRDDRREDQRRDRRVRPEHEHPRRPEHGVADEAADRRVQPVDRRHARPARRRPCPGGRGSRRARGRRRCPGATMHVGRSARRARRATDARCRGGRVRACRSPGNCRASRHPERGCTGTVGTRRALGRRRGSGRRRRRRTRWSSWRRRRQPGHQHRPGEQRHQRVGVDASARDSALVDAALQDVARTRRAARR